MKTDKTLNASWLDTPIGSMLAMGDEQALCMLQFMDQGDREPTLEKLRLKTKASIIPGDSNPIASIRKELNAYFKGKIQTFETPLSPLGSAFQKDAWEALMRIPYGQTWSYLNQAKALGKATAYRAVANANGANPIAIVIPCHRVINHNGKLGGYGGGIDRKAWLIEHEKRNLHSTKPSTPATLQVTGIDRNA